jgi:hypothetical protein
MSALIKSTGALTNQNQGLMLGNQTNNANMQILTTKENPLGIRKGLEGGSLSRPFFLSIFSLSSAIID